MRPLPKPRIRVAGRFRAPGRRKKEDMLARRSRQPKVAPVVEDAVRVAVSMTATVYGVHTACPRRGCRRAGRCHAAAEGDLCDQPMPPVAERAAIAMLVLVWRLANRQP